LRVVALAGGTGSAKLVRGLAKMGADLTIIGNVGDNFWIHGLYVCPDLDIAMYTLAGIEDREHGWGIQGDSFEILRRLAECGRPDWFVLGDKDITTQVLRTNYLREGLRLTEATAKLCEAYGLSAPILPVTDDQLETYISTSNGPLHIQEFWVREKGRPRTLGVDYYGSQEAVVTQEAAAALKLADRVVICPANPVTSIGLILAVPGMTELLRGVHGRITALSPMIGRFPFSGPAGKLMSATGIRPDSAGVDELYTDLLDALLIYSSDSGLAGDVEKTGVMPLISNTRIVSPNDEVRLARELVEA
jgi:LPPG:FO 2-phospho-L-lactate transferase